LAIQLYHFKLIIIPCNKLTTYWLYEDENKLFTNIKHQSSEKKRIIQIFSFTQNS